MRELPKAQLALAASVRRVFVPQSARLDKQSGPPSTTLVGVAVTLLLRHESQGAFQIRLPLFFFMMFIIPVPASRRLAVDYDNISKPILTHAEPVH